MLKYMFSRDDDTTCCSSSHVTASSDFDACFASWGVSLLNIETQFYKQIPSDSPTNLALLAPAVKNCFESSLIRVSSTFSEWNSSFVHKQQHWNFIHSTYRFTRYEKNKAHFCRYLIFDEKLEQLRKESLRQNKEKTQAVRRRFERITHCIKAERWNQINENWIVGRHIHNRQGRTFTIQFTNRQFNRRANGEEKSENNKNHSSTLSINSRESRESFSLILTATAHNFAEKPPKDRLPKSQHIKYWCFIDIFHFILGWSAHFWERERILICARKKSRENVLFFLGCAGVGGRVKQLFCFHHLSCWCFLLVRLPFHRWHAIDFLISRYMYYIMCSRALLLC